MKKEVLKINITTHKEIKETFSYSFEDNNGVRVTVEGIRSYDDVLRSIKKKTKTLNNYELEFINL